METILFIITVSLLLTIIIFLVGYISILKDKLNFERMINKKWEYLADNQFKARKKKN